MSNVAPWSVPVAMSTGSAPPAYAITILPLATATDSPTRSVASFVTVSVVLVGPGDDEVVVLVFLLLLLHAATSRSTKTGTIARRESFRIMLASLSICGEMKRNRTGSLYCLRSQEAGKADDARTMAAVGAG